MDAGSLLTSLLRNKTAQGFAGGLLAAVVLSQLGGRRSPDNIPRSTGGSSNTALKLGGLAAVGGLAYWAYKKYLAEDGGAAAGAKVKDWFSGMLDDPTKLPEDAKAFVPPESEPAKREAMSLAVIRAMVAAAKADGQIDAAEHEKIFGEIDEAALGAEEKSFLLSEIGKDTGADEIAKLAKTPQEAASLYVASVVAIDPNTPAEMGYLRALAEKLELDPKLVDEVHKQVAEQAGG